jgi:RNA recognition motif-containing protein
MEEPTEETIKEEMPFTEPDEELCEKIAQQVEFYFSDANITKDKFLLKHVKRNKEGFVSLKLISSFKRVKHLTKDWRQVAYALKKCSVKLEVNDLETKVRRLDELPAYDETTPSRTVVVLNLPMDRPTIEGVYDIFSICGEIVLIRILRPGNPIPADIKQYVAKHPEMTAKVCALVEFERTEFAQKAVRELAEEEDDKMKVMELTATPLKNGNKKVEARKLAEKAAAAAAMGKILPQRKLSLQHNFNQTMSNVMGPRARRISLMPNMKFSSISEEAKENVVPRKEYSLNPNAPSFQMAPDGTFQMVPPINQRRMSGYKPMVYMKQEDMAPAYINNPPPRRVSNNMAFAAMEANANAGLKLPPNVLRMPKGPENGKGFNNWCRQRMGEPKRASKAIPIVAPPQNIVTLDESIDNSSANDVCPGPSAPVPVPEIHVEAASGSEDEGAVDVIKSDSCDSGHEGSICSDPPDQDFEFTANERTR